MEEFRGRKRTEFDWEHLDREGGRFVTQAWVVKGVEEQMGKAADFTQKQTQSPARERGIGKREGWGMLN